MGGDVGIILRPKPDHAGKGHAPERNQQQRGGGQSKRRFDPARQRIGDEPGGMRQRKLRSKDSRSVLWPGRAVQHPVNGRLRQGEAEANNGPEQHQRGQSSGQRHAGSFGQHHCWQAS